MSEHQHQHQHQPFDPADVLDKGFWDERYRSGPALWSGQPNPQLVTEVAGLRPGTALDIGCGEGADAIWLADQGWQVTATDISVVALDRAAGHAGDRKITWVQGDITDWTLDTTYDLVSAHFIHADRTEREAFQRRFASAVAPGGSLLVVGHHPADLEFRLGRPDLTGFMFTAQDVAALLDPAEWEIVTCENRPRTVDDPDGAAVTVLDSTLRARRR
ncbi:MAG: class I SAM-dependent methyltransferase [Streptosporangiaceae bacterium]